MTLLLLSVCAILPLNIALRNETRGWCYAYLIIDLVFLLDIVLSFFMTIPRDEKKEECDNRWEIAKDYLNTWFFIDLLSICPFELFMQSLTGLPLEICVEKTIEE